MSNDNNGNGPKDDRGMGKEELRAMIRATDADTLALIATHAAEIRADWEAEDGPQESSDSADDARLERLAARHEWMLANRDAADAQDRAWEASELFRRWVELRELPVELASMILDETEIGSDRIMLRFRRRSD